MQDLKKNKRRINQSTLQHEAKESLNEEEIKAIEEITSNHEIKNYDEMAAILLKLRKKDNSGNYNK